MHKDLADPAKLTDSMKMFQMGLEGGKPGAGRGGRAAGMVLQGRRLDASSPPASRLPSPAFALDGGEEPEIAGIYLIGAGRHAVPPRLRARQRILRPRHRAAELSLARPFQAARLRARPGAAGRRAAAPTCAAPPASCATARSIWEKPFLSGEENMSHTIANLEPTISSTRCSAGPATCTCTSSAPRRCRSPTASRPQHGDVFEIEAEPFGLPLANPIGRGRRRPGRR